jgi:hypothetical protein
MLAKFAEMLCVLRVQLRVLSVSKRHLSKRLPTVAGLHEEGLSRPNA